MPAKPCSSEDVPHLDRAGKVRKFPIAYVCEYACTPDEAYARNHLLRYQQADIEESKRTAPCQRLVSLLGRS